MKVKTTLLLSILCVCAQVSAWSNVWQIFNQSKYEVKIKSASGKSGDNQNGIRMIIPPPSDVGCNLQVSGQTTIQGDVGNCEFTMPPLATVDKTWGFYIGDSAHGNYTVVTVNGKSTKFQDISYSGDYVRQDDNDAIQWPQSNFNIIIQPNGVPTLQPK